MAASARARKSRPWIGILFECCGIYSRLYRPPGARAYRGRCPRCLRAVRVPIGAGGQDVRILRAR